MKTGDGKLLFLFVWFGVNAFQFHQNQEKIVNKTENGPLLTRHFWPSPALLLNYLITNRIIYYPMPFTTSNVSLSLSIYFFLSSNLSIVPAKNTVEDTNLFYTL